MLTSRVVALASMLAEGATDGMAAVLAAMDTIVSLMTKVWDLMTGNPLLTLILATGLISIGVSAFCSIRRAARG